MEKEIALDEIQAAIAELSQWQDKVFFRFKMKQTKDGRMAELGRDGHGRLAIYVDGKEYQAYTQMWGAINDFLEL